MSESVIGREPIQLVEFVLPKCANAYGVLPCKAGLGNVDTSSMTVDFTAVGLGSEYIGADATLSVSPSGDGIRITATAGDPIFAINGTATTTFSGNSFRYAVMRGVWRSSANGEFNMWWFNDAGHVPAGGENAVATVYDLYWNELSFTDLSDGQEFIAVWDASDSTAYSTDWLGQTIDGIRFDLSDSASLVADIRSIQITELNPVDSVGKECFNTRATCQDPDNYQARPLDQLEADIVAAQGETTVSHSLVAGSVAFFRAEVFIPIDAAGVIFEIGAGAEGIYVGVSEGDFVVRCGDGSSVPAGDTARVAVDASPYEGTTQIIIGEFEDDGTDITATLYLFDPIGLELTQLGTDTTAYSGSLFGNNGWGIGTTNNFGDIAGGGISEDANDYNGTITNARFYNDKAATLFADQEAYRNNFFIGTGQKGEPEVGKPILSTLAGLGTIGTKINLSGADDDYRPLGRRATLDFTVSDFTHSDIGQDPYYATRPYNPFERSTFWRKWFARQKFGKVGARVKVYDGYADQTIDQYQARGYVLEEVKINEDGLSFYARDELARTELLKAQVPEASQGSLDADITIGATSLTMTGDFTDDYPATGTIRINDELMTYTSISYSDPTTTISGLTRGVDGSEASAHEDGDKVQKCRRFENLTVEEVIKELLIDDARIEAQLIDLDGLADEQSLYLSAYSLSTVLSEVSGVDQVLGWICQEVGVYIWWDERQQQIRIKAIRPVSGDDIVMTLTHEGAIVENTFKIVEKPRQRLNDIVIYYNPFDFAGDLSDVTNFANANKIINGTNSNVAQYGNVLQSRVLFSRFLTTNAEVAQTGARIANRYQDVPFEARLAVDAKDRSLWTGDIVRISTPVLVNAEGERSVRRWLIIEAEEPVPGHMAMFTVSDITLDGQIYVITEDGIGNYTAALFSEGNAFITNDDGTNLDGTIGATIA